MNRLSKSRAFTLIELLIVVVIIGVLAGVMLAVIRPQEQINKAKDGTVKAAMNKIALSIKGNISAYNRLPTGWGMLAGLVNAVAVNNSGVDQSATGAYCPNTGTGSTMCQFRINNAGLPATCASTYTGSGTSQCFYYYYADDVEATAFQLIAKSWGSDYLFVYDSDSSGAMSKDDTYTCPSDFAAGNDPATHAGCVKAQ